MLKVIFAQIILALFYPENSWLNELTSTKYLIFGEGQIRG